MNTNATDLNRPARTRSDECLDTLLEAAVLAPSGDNTQPWRFVVDRDRRSVTLDVDPSRDPSPMNAGQRMTRISLGAALENMARIAEHNGWDYAIEDTPESGVARFGLEQGTVPLEQGAVRPEKGTGAGSIEPLLRKRVTNRRVYDGTEIPADGVTRLREAKKRRLSEAGLVLLTDPGQRSRLVSLIARADSMMLSNRRIRDAFLAKVRFDAAPDAVVDEGLSLGSLEVSAVDRVFLRLLKAWSIPDGVARMLGARQTFASVAKRLAGSASGFCLITASRPGPLGDVHVGRVWQDIWLTLTDEGYASQPMMSLPVLQNILENGDRSIFAVADQDAIRRLLDEFQEFVSEFAHGRAAAIMRFGYAPPPKTQVGRLAWQAFLDPGQA